MKNIFKNMVEMQDVFNQKVHPEWRGEYFDNRLAAVLELGESIDSLPWKWWKKGSTDMDNFQVEIIDVWHFVMSIGLQKFSNHNLSTEIEDLWCTLDIDEYLEDSTFDLITETQRLMFLVLNNKFADGNLEDIISQLILITKYIGITDEVDLYKNYLVKNVLNKFRQDNGYKDGTYIKMWTGNDNKKYEDNVIAWEIMDDIIDKDKELTFDEIYAELSIFYTEMEK